MCMDGHNTSMSVQQPKMPIFEPYRDFAKLLRGLSHRSLSLIVKRVAVLIDLRMASTKSISSKAAQKANSAHHGHCNSQENLDHIGKFPEKGKLVGDAGTANNHREDFSCGCKVSVSGASPEFEGHPALIAAASGCAQLRFASQD